MSGYLVPSVSPTLTLSQTGSSAWSSWSWSARAWTRCDATWSRWRNGFRSITTTIWSATIRPRRPLSTGKTRPWTPWLVDCTTQRLWSIPKFRLSMILDLCRRWRLWTNSAKPFCCRESWDNLLILDHELRFLTPYYNRLINQDWLPAWWLQRDQIWQNFATLAEFQKSLAIFWGGLFSIWQNFDPSWVEMLWCF